jgi:hypothetical protein
MRCARLGLGLGQVFDVLFACSLHFCLFGLHMSAKSLPEEEEEEECRENRPHLLLLDYSP